MVADNRLGSERSQNRNNSSTAAYSESQAKANALPGNNFWWHQGLQGGMQAGQTGRSGAGPRKCPMRDPSNYTLGNHLGNGSFGVVREAICIPTGDKVAIKKVLQDPRYKNRELEVMKELNHQNVVELKDYFYTEASATSREGNRSNNEVDGNAHKQRFLNVVMEHIPSTAYCVVKTYSSNKEPVPMILVQLYTYQLCRALGYLHSLGVCHRDVKPQNLLVNTRTHVLKLCDFGSAKRLVATEPSVAYICSRFYRAPELMLGATIYSTAIDLWSIGCVLGELLLGKPLFSGADSVDQLVKIIQILGTPTTSDMKAMNPNYTDFRFPDLRQKEWRRVFSSGCNDSWIPSEALALLNSFLRYDPASRITAFDALAHPFFGVLREKDARLPDGSPLPELFNFVDEELLMMHPETRQIVIPAWYRQKRVAQKSSTASSKQGKAVYTPTSQGSLVMSNSNEGGGVDESSVGSQPIYPDYTNEIRSGIPRSASRGLPSLSSANLATKQYFWK